MKYTASVLRHEIERIVKTRTPDGGGGVDETWGPLSPPLIVPAMIKPMSARERWFAQQTSSTERLLIVIRYAPGWDQSQRVKFDNRMFEILALIDVDERHNWLEMDCEERQAG